MSKMSSRLFSITLLAFILVQIASSSDISLNEDLSSSKNFTAVLSPHGVPSSETNRSEPGKSPVATVSIVSPTKAMAENISETELIHETWKMFEKSMKMTIDDQMKKVLPKFLKMVSEANISTECSKSAMAVVQGIMELKSWAFRMLDATAKIPSGILDGTIVDLGDFDECVAIENLDYLKKVQFTGQYCTMEVNPLMPAPPHRVQFKTKVLDFSKFSEPDSVFSDFAGEATLFYYVSARLGLCIPSTCTVNDLQNIVNVAIKNVPLKVKVKSCEVKEPFQVSGLQIACMTIIGTIVLLAIVGTFIDVKASIPSNSGNKICSGIVADSLRSFSIEKNLRNLLKINHSKDNFGVLNGLRTLTTAWVVLTHIYYLTHKQGSARRANMQDILNEVTSGTIVSAFVDVDSFFMMGGFLVVYSNLRSLEKENGRMNFIRYYLHRIWRLTPPLIGVLLITFLLPLLGSGPFFKEVVGHEVGNCETNWWHVVINFINAWTDSKGMCLSHTWYVSVDMHLYFLAPVIFIPLYKWPVIGFLIMFFLTVACMGAVAALTVIHDFYPTVLLFTPDLMFSHAISNMMHIRFFSHIGPYCVGLALGYIVLRFRNVDLKPIYQVLGWCAAIACNLTVLYGPFEWQRGNLPSKFVEVSYAMLFRTAWAMGIAWLVYICITGRGGIINRFLSWDFFTPLARLSYSVYIIHMPTLWVRNGVRRQLIMLTHYDFFYEYLATITLSLCLSITFHLLFEAPFFNLEGVWFPKNGRELKKSSEKEDSPVNVTSMKPCQQP